LANPTLENGTIIRNIPYPVILHKKIKKWLAENNNQLPTYKMIPNSKITEIQLFKKMIKEGLQNFDYE
jgi:hypothetical protein